MKPTRNKAPPRTPRKTPSKFKVVTKDPVNVYCRIRPMQLDNEVSCMHVVSPTTVQLVPPESAVNYRPGMYKEIQYTFKRVFGETASQKEVFKEVALPLVEDLILGRNGLLFTYGVTGCGKTYTMTGEPNNGGIMPRCLDVLFNSISELQANKFVFKPDRMNGFDIQCESDARIDLQNELHGGSLTTKTSKTPLKRKNVDSKFQQSYDSTKIENVEEDNTYAVFVTYVEIYNNSVYDLLEDISDEMVRTKSLQTKIVREDASHNMYVHGVTEIEVKSTKEAFDVFYMGQKRKRMAHTTLNAESSRSHSVFTVRLVQAPMDDRGEHIIDDKKVMCISQLSLVDLAGSERTNRTKNSGQRLREAGNINNSLMTLRNCLEILRENQLQGTNKMVPYRDSRVTHLFKNYFDGEGQIRMVVCVNPRTDDYDETVQVMKFAEMTQEVQIARPLTSKNIDLDLMPGRRKANQIFKQAIQTMKENGNVEAENIEVDLGIVYSLGPPFPQLLLQNSSDSHIVKDLVAFLEYRMNRRSLLLKDIKAKEEQFRNQLVNIEKENILTKQEASSLKAILDQERKKTILLESRLMNTDSQNSNAQRNVDSLEMEIRALRQEVEEKDMLLNQRMLEKEKVKQKYSDKMAEEKAKMSREMEQRLKDHKTDLKNKMRGKDEKLRLMKRILVEDNMSTPHSTVSSHTGLGKYEASLYPTPNPSENNVLPSQIFQNPRVTKKMGPAVSNPRHRRSRSANGDVWIDHRPAVPVPLGTVLQPYMKRRISVTTLSEVKDVTSQASKYCLTTQEQDTDGEVETRLVKGDVVPTTGGGAQVIFNDVETLRQESPTSPRKRKSISESNSILNPSETQSKCAISIEGHGKRQRNK